MSCIEELDLCVRQVLSKRLYLRHSVCTAEKIRSLCAGMREILPVFRDYSHANRTGENGPLGIGCHPVPAFLRKAHSQSGFH